MTERVVIDETKVDYEKGIVREEFIRRTDDTETYPSGWKYRLHYGTLDGETIVRYLENQRFSTTRRNGSAVSR